MAPPAPPPTRFGPAACQAKAATGAPAPRHAPPPTRFAAAAAQPKPAGAPPSRPGAAPPPTRFAPAAAQPKPAPQAAPARPVAPPPSVAPTRPAAPPRPPATPARPSTVQGKIVLTGGVWQVQGRVTGHDSAGNRNALSAKIRMRANGAITSPDAANNDWENLLLATAGGAAGGDFIRGKLKMNNLAICHKMSSEMVQQTIVNAANGGVWTEVDAMVDAIAGSGWADNTHMFYEGIFDARVTLNHTNATALLNAIKTTPMTHMTAANLTTLAGYIANSPANLFVGNQTINASIQSDGDFNSTEETPIVWNTNGTLRRRRLTLDSNSIYATLNATPTGFPPQLAPVDHTTALGSAMGTNRNAWAVAAGGGAHASTYLSSSGLPAEGFAFL